MVFKRLRAQRRQLDDELFAHRGRERRRDPDMVQRVIVVVEAQQERADHRAGALLVPAEARDHAVSRALVLHLDHRAFPGAIGRVETLCHDTIEPGALEAAEPVRRKRSIARSRREVHRGRRAGQHVLKPFAPHTAMPTAPPRLRIMLNRPLAYLSRSGGKLPSPSVTLGATANTCGNPRSTCGQNSWSDPQSCVMKLKDHIARPNDAMPNIMSQRASNRLARMM